MSNLPRVEASKPGLIRFYIKVRESQAREINGIKFGPATPARLDTFSHTDALYIAQKYFGPDVDWPIVEQAIEKDIFSNAKPLPSPIIALPLHFHCPVESPNLESITTSTVILEHCDWVGPNYATRYVILELPDPSQATITALTIKVLRRKKQDIVDRAARETQQIEEKIVNLRALPHQARSNQP